MVCEYNLHPTNHTDNLFNQTSANRQKVKYGGLYFVDFAKNQESSPDGYVYLIVHGSNSSFPVESWNGIEYIRGLDGVVKAQPLFTFLNKTGTVTASYVPALKKYLMVVSTASFPGVASMRREYDIYILESNRLEGPYFGYSANWDFMNMPIHRIVVMLFVYCLRNLF